MSDPARNLTPKQLAAVAALLVAPTIEVAAATTGVDSRTIRRWFHETPFKRALWEARREVMNQVVIRLQSAAGRAVDTLVRHLDSGRPADEIRAASIILEKATGVGEVEEVHDQLTDLLRELKVKPE
jgi:hypothetical protein